MITEPAFKKILKWRYLDSLDSIRYSRTDLLIRGDEIPERVEQASIEMCATILMGNGIIIPVNQLFDSFGFLRIMSETIKAYDVYYNKGKHVFMPIKYAFYDYRHEIDLGGGPHLIDPFLMTAYQFDKDGKEGRPFFQLSAWPDLDEKRRKWANKLREKSAIPNGLINLDDDYEPKLAEDLLRVLSFFDRNRGLILEAAQTTNTREDMVRYISNLSRENVEKDKYFIDILATKDTDNNENKLDKILEIVSVFSKLEKRVLEGRSIIDNRSKVRKELFDNGAEYFNGDPESIGLIRMGVSATVDSIYNFSQYKSTFAKQDNQSELMKKDSFWGYDEAAFALGQWAREKYETSHTGSKDDISSIQDAYINPKGIDSPFVNSNFDNFWVNFFDFQRAGEWIRSLDDYARQLEFFEMMRKDYVKCSPDEKTEVKRNQLLSAKQKYEEVRNNHILLVNKFLERNNYRIKTDKQKAVLEHYQNGNLDSMIQIEDFAESALLSRQEKGALYAGKPSENISAKSRTAEFDE